MTREEVKKVVFEELAHLAPEADLSALPAKARLREELDLDSFDFGRLLTAFDARLHVAVPETDAAQLETLEGCVEYLQARLP